MTAGKNDKELHKKILNIELVYPPHFSASLKSLITAMMVYNPLSRPTCEQVLDLGWFRSATTS